MLPDSPDPRFEMLLDLYAPLCRDEDTAEEYRDPSCGLITHEELIMAMNADAGAA